MDFKHEFSTVDLLITSNFETRGVDAFILALIKVEKQMRRIFTFLIFQHSNFSETKHALELRDVLSDNRDMYFENFINGIDKIYSKSVKSIYGENYNEDLEKIKEIVKDRNKIFHGQITSKKLSRKELLEKVEILKNWSKKVAEKFEAEIGYDGFARNSYQKAKKELNLISINDFSSVEKFKTLLEEIDRKGNLKIKRHFKEPK